MMSITFKQPEIRADDTKRAKELVEQMHALVKELLNWGTESKDRKGRILDPEQRKYLTDAGYPSSLVSNVAFFTEQVSVMRADELVAEDIVMAGFTADAFDSTLYASQEIKDALFESHFGRCAYCETLINQSAYGDVEHFRPKAAYTEQGSVALYRPAYYFLAYEPQNLFLSCQLCNEAYKQNYFPVIGSRVPEVTWEKEISVLINPYREDPRDCIRFNPVNGRAYPFDLIRAFYAATKGWGPPDTEREIWKDPSKIPSQTDATGQSITDQTVNPVFGEWLKQQRDPMLSRGNRTITILNLNRAALVRARLNHLRQLRCVIWTAALTNTDQTAANELGGVLLGTDPRRAAAAPEYLSLSIDAVQTWRIGPSAQNGTVASYNKALEAFVPKEAMVTPSPYNDALMYLVLDADRNLVGQRRVVYITDKDRVYGQPKGRTGIFLAIDWGAELKNSVELRDGEKVIRRTTLRDLIGGPSKQLWRTFENYDVWAIGDYEVIKDVK